MMIKMPVMANEKSVPTNNAILSMQRLRLRRFKIALSTYAVGLLATFLVTCLGLGVMSDAQWATYIGPALLGNGIFFLLFHTNANLRFSDPSLTKEQIIYSAIIELKDAIEKVQTLSGLLPICASCKKIRDDKGYWQQIEAYIREHSEAEFSHSVCPECAKELYPEVYDDKK